jgi:citrate synthase
MVDQPRRDDAQWLSASDAARALGVQRRSLYSYVSRGLVRSMPGAQGRQRLYAREDLERLQVRRDARAGHGAVAAGALQFGEAVLDSAITEITAHGPSYRGYLATELAARAVPFENVAELLWSGALCDDAVRWPASPSQARLRARAGAAPAPTVADVLLEVVLQAGRDDAERADARADTVTRCGRSLIPKLAIACHPGSTGSDRQRAARQSGIAAMLSAAWQLPATAVGAVDTALVLIADHELTASTFAARLAASTGADPYAVMLAALATLSGPRHGTAALEVGRFLTEVGTPAHAGAAVRALRARHRIPPGFGHRAYTGTDPRARVLLELAEQRTPSNARFHRRVRTARAIADAVAKDGVYPNVDFAMVVLAAALGAPFEIASAWFAIGRSAGWLAHAQEQRAAGSLLRPRARYVGVPRRSIDVIDSAVHS